MIRGVVAGIVAVIVVALLCGYAAVRAGLMPANADGKPWKIERWAAKTSLNATLARSAPASPNPLPATDANYLAGIKLYAQNCAVCHGAEHGDPSKIARGLYQRPPQLGKHGVEDDPDGETYWKVKHGIRFTGMPAFGSTLEERQLWQLTLFLKHMNALPPAAERAWKAVPAD